MGDTGDVAGAVGTVDGATGVDEVGTVAVDIAAQASTGEGALHHSADQNFGCDFGAFHGAGIADQIHSQATRPVGIVAASGQLDVASAFETNSVSGLVIAQGPSTFVGASRGELFHVGAGSGLVSAVARI